MTELWSFEVTVKNVMNTGGAAAAGQNFYFICLGLPDSLIFLMVIMTPGVTIIQLDLS